MPTWRRRCGRAGFDVADEEIVTAVVATAEHLGRLHPGAQVFVLSDGDATADLVGIDLVDVDDADVIVIGGASDDFTYATMNRIFRRLMDGAALVGMHRNLFWKTDRGMGAGRRGLPRRTRGGRGHTATICGKPEKRVLRCRARDARRGRGRAAMVGDDVVNDVLGAQASGLTGILVRTGKYRPGDEDTRRRSARSRPGVVRRRSRLPRVRVGAGVGVRAQPVRAPPLRGHRAAVRPDGRAAVVRPGCSVAPIPRLQDERGPGRVGLDVAAGTQLVSRALAAGRNVHVVALDQSEPMLRAGASPTVSPASTAGSRRCSARPSSSRSPTESFDAVTVTYLLRYVEDPEATVRELARVLRPGGSIAMLEFPSRTLRSLGSAGGSTPGS